MGRSYMLILPRQNILIMKYHIAPSERVTRGGEGGRGGWVEWSPDPLPVSRKINHLYPIVNMHIFYTVLYTFHEALTRRICFKMKSL